jgi:hypothetical protein
MTPTEPAAMASYVTGWLPLPFSPRAYTRFSQHNRQTGCVRTFAMARSMTSLGTPSAFARLRMFASGAFSATSAEPPAALHAQQAFQSHSEAQHVLRAATTRSYGA